MPILIDGKELDLKESKKESLRQQKIRLAKKREDSAVVGPGQNVTSIADKYGVSTEALIAKNKGAFPLVTGQTLRLPRFDSEFGPKGPNPQGYQRLNAPNFLGEWGTREFSALTGAQPSVLARDYANKPYQYSVQPPAEPRGTLNSQQNGSYKPPKPTGNIQEDRKIGQFEIFRNAANTTGQMSGAALQRLADIAGITYQEAASNLKAQHFEFEPSTGRWVNPGIVAQANQSADSNGVSGNWETGWSIPGSTPNQSAYIAPNIHGSAWQVKIVEVSPGVWERRTVPTYGQFGRGGQGGAAHGRSGTDRGFGWSDSAAPQLDQFGNPIRPGIWHV